MGFHYTPREEIEVRLDKVREGMAGQGIDALLVVQKMDCFYLSGTSQDAVLFVPRTGDPLLLVKRELERAILDSPLSHVVGFQSLQELPALIGDHYGQEIRNLGLEFDVLPVKEYLRYGELFPQSRLVDSSSIIKDARKVKTPFELAQMRGAGEIIRQVFEKARGFIKEGLTEIEVGGLMDLTAKRYGHEGLARVRSMNYEAYTWHVLSGWTGGIVSVFSIGKMDDRWIAAYDAMSQVYDAVLEDTRPGANCQELFRKSVRLAHELGYKDSYLGPPGLQTTFVAHGIGLELGEFPYLAEGHDYPLEQGMVFSLEPKVVFPGEGAVGIENTVVVTEDGYDVLTPVPQEIFQV
jgi:Xaa-Pro dipeptidase